MNKDILNIIIFGAPGSGKGTQSELLIEKYNLDHISTGEVLRAEIEKQTELGKIANIHISKGHLVPDELIIDTLENVLDEKENSNGIIFDGFPRTIAQGEALEKILEERGTSVTIVLNLEVEKEELVQRLLNRGKVSGRSDDNFETISSRLNVYTEQTAPLINYYKKQGKLVNIKGAGTVEDIFEKIVHSIDNIKVC